MYVIIKLRFVLHQWHHACVNECHIMLLIYSSKWVAFLHNPSVKAWEQGTSKHREDAESFVSMWDIRGRPRWGSCSAAFSCADADMRYFLQWIGHMLCLAMQARCRGNCSNRVLQTLLCKHSKYQLSLEELLPQPVPHSFESSMNEHDNPSISIMLEGKLSTDTEDETNHTGIEWVRGQLLPAVFCFVSCLYLTPRKFSLLPRSRRHLSSWSWHQVGCPWKTSCNMKSDCCQSMTIIRWVWNICNIHVQKGLKTFML